MGDENAQTGRRSINSRTPFGMIRQKPRDARTSRYLSAAFHPFERTLLRDGNRPCCNNRDESEQQADASTGSQPANEDCDNQKNEDCNAREGIGRTQRIVDVGEQDIRRIETTSAVGIARNDRVAMPAHDLFANRHANGAVVRNLRFAALEAFTREDALECFFSAVIGIGLSIVLTRIGPTKAANGDGSTVAYFLGTALGPVLGNEHYDTQDVQKNGRPDKAAR